MGSNDDPSEKPIHRVTIKPFAISKFPITNREWKECVAAKACDYVPDGNDDAPVANVSWNDAQQFVEWLSKVTQKNLSTSERGRMGIRRARRYTDEILVGRSISIRYGQLQRMRYSLRFDATAKGRELQTKPIRPS